MSAVLEACRLEAGHCESMVAYPELFLSGVARETADEGLVQIAVLEAHSCAAFGVCVLSGQRGGATGDKSERQARTPLVREFGAPPEEDTTCTGLVEVYSNQRLIKSSLRTY